MDEKDLPSFDDRNSEEAIAARSAQDDPIIMYLVVRDLGMSAGKIAAQCAHGSQLLTLQYCKLVNSDTLSIQEHIEYKIFHEWLHCSFRKVVLRCDDKKWKKLKEQITNYEVVVDAGLTEIPVGSETVLAIWPMRKSEVPRIIKKMQTLK